MVLGHSQQQQQHQGQGSIVVSGVSNNLFTSPMPPQPPATPPYTHVQTNKENHLPQSSPYYGNTSSLAIPGFKPGVTGLNALDPIGSMHAAQNNGININQQQPKKQIITTGTQQMMKFKPQQIINTANMTINAQQKKINVSGNMNNNNNVQQQRIKPAPLKVNNITSPQHQDEGNLTPKSQASDEEGQDDKK